MIWNMDLPERSFGVAPQPIQNLKVWGCVAGVHGLLWLALTQNFSHSHRQKVQQAQPPTETYVLLDSSVEPFGVLELSKADASKPAPASAQANTPSRYSRSVPVSAVSILASSPQNSPASEAHRVERDLPSNVTSLPIASLANPATNLLPTESTGVSGASIRGDEGAPRASLGHRAGNPSNVVEGEASSGHSIAMSPIKPIHAPSPAYPALSQQMGEQGTVWVSMRIDEQGKPSDIRIKTTSGHGRLDQAALTGVRHWRFPAAQATPSGPHRQVELPVIFKLSGP